MTLPNFLVIGSGRSGTTSLHYYLKEHPQVYLPTVKSPGHFFCHGHRMETDPHIHYITENHFVPDPAAYESLFDDVRDEIAIGEVSPVYLATVHAADRIAERLPGVKLIAVLRNPVDRVWARYVGRYRDGLERRSDFSRIVEEERTQPLIRDDAHGTYLSAGFISHFLQSYLRRFSREQIRIHLFEDLRESPATVMQDLFKFLEVNPVFKPNIARRYNSSGGIIGNALLRGVWTRSTLIRVCLRPYVPGSIRDAVFAVLTRRLVPLRLDPELHAELVELYRPDTERLQSLLDRDLSHWLERSGLSAPSLGNTGQWKPGGLGE